MFIKQNHSNKCWQQQCSCICGALSTPGPLVSLFISLAMVWHGRTLRQLHHFIYVHTYKIYLYGKWLIVTHTASKSRTNNNNVLEWVVYIFVWMARLFVLYVLLRWTGSINLMFGDLNDDSAYGVRPHTEHRAYNEFAIYKTAAATRTHINSINIMDMDILVLFSCGVWLRRMTNGTHYCVSMANMYDYPSFVVVNSI